MTSPHNHPDGNIHGQNQHPGHGHSHTQHPHARASAPATEGRVIRRARLYDLGISIMSLGQSRALRKVPIDLAALQPGETVLDVGCGTGDVTLAAARRVGPGGAVYGIDPSAQMIDLARRKAGRTGSAVTFSVEPVESMTFPDASFDVVISSLMMHHLPPDLRRRALGEIQRVLRPGGRLVIVDLQPPSRLPRPWEPGWMITRVHKMHKPNLAAEARTGGTILTDALREAGFDAIESGPTRYPWLGYARGYVR